MLYPEKLTPHAHLFARAKDLTCQRRQRLSPREDSLYHPTKYEEFLAKFLNGEGVEISEENGFLLAGNSEFFVIAAKHISNRRREIMEITEKTPDHFIVFLGSGHDMWSRYRALGSRIPRIHSEIYPCSVAGGGDCFINTDYLRRPLDPRAVKRILTHEPSQVIYGLCLKDDKGNPTWQLKDDRLCAEVLAGPLDPEAWGDINAEEHSVDFSGLKEDGSNFWPWLNQKWDEYYLRYERKFISHLLTGDDEWPCTQPKPPYLLSPLIKLFYRWAAGEGGEKDWWEKAKSLS